MNPLSAFERSAYWRSRLHPDCLKPGILDPRFQEMGDPPEAYNQPPRSDIPTLFMRNRIMALLPLAAQNKLENQPGFAPRIYEARGIGPYGQGECYQDVSLDAIRKEWERIFDARNIPPLSYRLLTDTETGILTKPKGAPQAQVFLGVYSRERN